MLQIKPRHLVSLMLCSAFLMSCSDNSKSLDDYIAKVKSRNAGQIDPLPTPVAYQQFAYPKTHPRDPFVKVVEHAANGLKPDLQRPKEALEAFAVDSLRMVGTVTQDNTLWAIVAAPDGVVYRVHVGSYLGQNFGVIKKISASEVLLEEAVENNGTWEKRPAKLTLVEGEA